MIPTAQAGAATTETVTNCNSSGPGSLLRIVKDASSGETVSFVIPPACSTITLRTVLAITTNLTINGPGAGRLAISGNHSQPVITVGNGKRPPTVTISGLTVEDGDGGFGGGILNGGTLSLNSVSVSDNSGGEMRTVAHSSCRTAW